MSDTPETDAATITRIGQIATAVVDLEFARKLERERNKARKLAEAAMFEADRLRGRLARLEALK